MVFDPIQSFFGPGVDMNRSNNTRPILDAVSRLCRDYDCTPLYIRHHGKTPRDNAAHASLGSVDISANMRSVLTVYKDPDDKDRRVLAHTVTNGPVGPSMQFRLSGASYNTLVDTEDGEELLTVEDVRVDWDGMSDLTAADLNARATAHGNDTQEASSALEQACDFLSELLQDGPALASDLQTHARNVGVSRSTLFRAKDRLHIKAQRQHHADLPSAKWPWVWALPEAEEE
jgi:putative DNA primase/helicase